MKFQLPTKNVPTRDHTLVYVYTGPNVLPLNSTRTRTATQSRTRGRASRRAATAAGLLRRVERTVHHYNVTTVLDLDLVDLHVPRRTPYM
jgi:hypothetical protein